ncbi:unnamed protein product [Ambrosiozyma monospora]|uniref:Unnamed protein product n=1 Tax=Ambrosiozyma monospora TaxID=43982 RepID=A0ACB5U0Q1_AMBMO|nr:unnamed protein product [Ambrosiozyma monospora]
MDSNLIPVPSVPGIASPLGPPTGIMKPANQFALHNPYQQQQQQSQQQSQPLQQQPTMPRHSHSRTLSKLNPPLQNMMPPSADNSSPIIGRSRKNTAGPPRTQRGGSMHGGSFSAAGLPGLPPTHHHFTPAPVVINPELLVTRQWPLFSFSATGSCSSLIPSSDGYGHHSNNIKVTEINNVLSEQDALIKSFPGPLQKNKSKAKDIEKWIDERLRSIGSDGEVFVTGEQLLWGVLKVMLDKIHKKDDFTKNEEYIKQVVKVLNPTLVIKDIGSTVDVVTC